jgi:hypothetical protein
VQLLWNKQKRWQKQWGNAYSSSITWLEQFRGKSEIFASDMIMNIHSDTSYLSKTKARSRACGHFFMGWMPKTGEPIKINGAFYVNATILKFVVASAAEAELGTLFHNCQDGIIFRQTLSNMGHPQPKMPVDCNNATVVGIANNTVKRQRLVNGNEIFLGR